MLASLPVFVSLPIKRECKEMQLGSDVRRLEARRVTVSADTSETPAASHRCGDTAQSPLMPCARGSVDVGSGEIL